MKLKRYNWRLRRIYSLTNSDVSYKLLEPDADEILLELLARDKEPIYKPDMPHRRYVLPDDLYRDSCIDYIRRSMDWERITYDWWVKKGDNYGRPK